MVANLQVHSPSIVKNHDKITLLSKSQQGRFHHGVRTSSSSSLSTSSAPPTSTIATTTTTTTTTTSATIKSTSRRNHRNQCHNENGVSNHTNKNENGNGNGIDNDNDRNNDTGSTTIRFSNKVYYYEIPNRYTLLQSEKDVMYWNKFELKQILDDIVYAMRQRHLRIITGQVPSLYDYNNNDNDNHHHHEYYDIDDNNENYGHEYDTYGSYDDHDEHHDDDVDHDDNYQYRKKDSHYQHGQEQQQYDDADEHIRGLEAFTIHSIERGKRLRKAISCILRRQQEQKLQQQDGRRRQRRRQVLQYSNGNNNHHHHATTTAATATDNSNNNNNNNNIHDNSNMIDEHWLQGTYRPYYSQVAATIARERGIQDEESVPYVSIPKQRIMIR